MIKILFICHGNICRSTMAQSVMAHLIKQQGKTDQFVIESAATSTEEIGNPPHHGTVNKLRQMQIPVIPHRAVQMKKNDYDNYDFLIGMDDANIRNMIRICGNRCEKIHKLLESSRSLATVGETSFPSDFASTY